MMIKASCYTRIYLLEPRNSAIWNQHVFGFGIKGRMRVNQEIDLYAVWGDRPIDCRATPIYGLAIVHCKERK